MGLLETRHTSERLDGIRRLIEDAGYAYDRRQNVFYSLQDPWQRRMGYCSLYDDWAPLAGMVFDCEPVRFAYNGKRWLIEFWKGQYGITAGGEIGIYNTSRPDVDIAGVFGGTFYDCARDDERLDMRFSLARNGNTLFTRSGRHWWLTGFVLGEYANPSDLTMEASLTFTDPGMHDAFLEALCKLGYTRADALSNGGTVRIRFATPKSRQPAARRGLIGKLALIRDRALTALFRWATRGSGDIYGMLAGLKENAPILYRHAVDLGRQAKQFKPVSKPAFKAVRLSCAGRLDRAFQSAPVLTITDSSRIVIMSDCHRGCGDVADDLVTNQTIFYAALNAYYRQGYTYIELGDGDELWKTKCISDIAAAHGDLFALLARFYRDSRLWQVYGNHDIVKKYGFSKLDAYCEEATGQRSPLLPGAPVTEGLLLRYAPVRKHIFLLHGHQADFLNDTLWRLARFLVRHVWRRLELLGFKDPTSASKNNKVKMKIEKRLTQWASVKNVPVIAGHTHRPVFPEPAHGIYFNDGCGVHPGYVTAIEIVSGSLSLVSWGQKTRDDGTVYVGKDVVAEPARLTDYLL